MNNDKIVVCGEAIYDLFAASPHAVEKLDHAFSHVAIGPQLFVYWSKLDPMEAKLMDCDEYTEAFMSDAEQAEDVE